MSEDRFNDLNERLRKAIQILSVCFGFSIINGVFLIANFIYFVGTYNDDDLIAVFLGVPFVLEILLIVICVVQLVKRETVCKELYNGYIDRAFESCGIQNYNRCAKPLSENEIESLDIFKMGNHFSWERVAEFEYDGLDIIRSDINIANEEKRTRSYTDSDGKTHEETYTETTVYFNGTLFIFKMEHPGVNQVNIYSRWFFGNPRHAHRVKMDSIVFNKRYITYSVYDLDVFKILKPQKNGTNPRFWQFI